jgi:6-phosphogluconolactonase (cycloisomerase 2 family)
VKTVVVRALLLLSFSSVIISVASATVPVVQVSSPGNGAQVTSPVHYVATASSPQCKSGIAAMRIYSAPHTDAYDVSGGSLNANVNFTPGTYNTVVQAWDNCGGVGKTAVAITVGGNAAAAPRFLYTTEFGAGKVAGFLVDASTGALQATGQPPVWAHWGPTRVASDKGGYRLYVANQGSHDLNAYFINRSNGYLSPVPGSPIATGGTGQGVAVAPSGKYVFVITDSSDGGTTGVAAFMVNSNGSLTPVAGSPFQTQSSPAAIAIDPSGKYVYVSHSLVNSSPGYEIDAYTINPNDGALTPVPGSPFIAPQPDQFQCPLCGAGGGIFDLAIDPQGKYLLAPVYSDGTVDVFKIDPTTGTLTPVSGSPFVDVYPNSPSFNGAEPLSIAISPLDNYVYTSAQSYPGTGGIGTSSLITEWSFNPSTGALTRVTTQSDPGNVCNEHVMRTDPSGKFLYEPAFTNCQMGTPGGAILGFSINQSNGSLTLLPGMPLSLGYTELNPIDGIAITP